jgi:predicted site-specific integrase-resolvase
MADDDRVEPWTIRELAKAAGVDPSYIRRLCVSGRMQLIKPADLWVIPAEEGQTWLRARQARKAAEYARLNEFWWKRPPMTW